MKRSILLVCGSLRAQSLNLTVLKAAAEVAGPAITTRLYGGTAVLPHYHPDDDREPLHPSVAGSRSAIGWADALLFCTPEYAGALPGSFKNLLDWTVGGTEMNGKPVAWINTASPAAPTGGRDAHASLRKVLGYVAANIVESACIHVPMSPGDVEGDGTIRSVSIRSRIAGSPDRWTHWRTLDEALYGLTLFTLAVLLGHFRHLKACCPFRVDLAAVQRAFRAMLAELGYEPVAGFAVLAIRRRRPACRKPGSDGV